MRDVKIDEWCGWPDSNPQVKEEDFSKADVKRGYNSTPMDREPLYGSDVRTSVRQRAVGKEETYKRGGE